MVRASALLFCILLFHLKQQKSGSVEQHAKLRACCESELTKTLLRNYCGESNWNITPIFPLLPLLKIKKQPTPLSQFDLHSLKDWGGAGCEQDLHTGLLTSLAASECTCLDVVNTSQRFLEWHLPTRTILIWCWWMMCAMWLQVLFSLKAVVLMCKLWEVLSFLQQSLKIYTSTLVPSTHTLNVKS